MSQHATPVLLGADGDVQVLRRIPLAETDAGLRYDEAFVETLLFQQPSVLPIREVDAAYSDPVPVCTQLSTRVGPLDILYVTREGRLVIVEAKLWRNPEARRKVVAQIIDYAAELGRWSYTDLEREVSKRRGRLGNTLFSIVREHYPEIEEADFVDNVSRSLREGRFLLLICGDGIREELASIAEFLDRNTTLDLTFGLLELAIYRTDGGGRLILPRILAKTVTIKRQVLRLEGGVPILIEEADGNDEPRPPSPDQQVFVRFWSDLAAAMMFDDPSQPPITIAKAPNTTLRMPTPRSWITLYFSSSLQSIGVFLAFNRGELGDTFYAQLLADRDDIAAELPPGTTWESVGGRHRIQVDAPLPDLSNEVERARAIGWFADTANQFVNAFRPRLSRYVREL